MTRGRDLGASATAQKQVVEFSGVTVELDMDPRLAATALRAFMGKTLLDAEIDNGPVPSRPGWLNLVIRSLRWYRDIRPQWVGARCVFDPSCSRYAERAFQKHGFFKGMLVTLCRLHRCKPGAGGIDIP